MEKFIATVLILAALAWGYDSYIDPIMDDAEAIGEATETDVGSMRTTFEAN